MTEAVTVKGREIPVSGIQRTDLSGWWGDVPEEINLDRLYWPEDQIHGEVWCPDGSVIETIWDEDAWEARRLTNPSAVDPAEDVLWERPGRAERELSMLVSDGGLSAAEALDFWIVEIRGQTGSEWAALRGTSHQAVNKNVRNARQKLSA